MTSIRLIKILHNLKKSNNKLISREEFLECLNKEIEAITKNEVKKYKFIYTLNIKKPINLKFRDIKIEDEGFKEDTKREIQIEKFFENILNLFGVKKINTEKYFTEESNVKTSKIEKIINICNSYDGEVFEVDVNGRDENFAIKKANYKLNACLGFISFVFNILKTEFPSYKEDYSMFEIKPKYVFVIENQDRVNHFHWSYILYNEKQIMRELSNMNLKSLKFMDKFNTFTSYCKIIKKVDNIGLVNTLNDIFNLYYSAISEKSLNYSFLKFWVLSEYLIKKSGGKSDDQMLKIMEKIFKLYEPDDFLSKRMEFLHKKEII